MAAVARGFSTYLAQLCNLRPKFFVVSAGSGFTLDFMAAGVILLMSVLLSVGVRESALFISSGCWAPMEQHSVWRGGGRRVGCEASCLCHYRTQGCSAVLALWLPFLATFAPPLSRSIASDASCTPQMHLLAELAPRWLPQVSQY